MKHKNVLLVVFFLTLFVFQQVQAGGNLPSVGRPSGMNAPLANTFLFDDVYVQIYPLRGDGTIQPGSVPCTLPNDPTPGCPGTEPPTWCKAGSANQDPTYKFYYLCTDQDYLPDVLAKEMDLVEIYPPVPEALKAQAVAARTFASYKSKNFGDYEIVNGTGVYIINNSTAFQVYEPNSSSNSGYDTQIRSAVNNTADEFIYYLWNGMHTIDAEFGSDALNNTTTEPASSPKPYLMGVADPISSLVDGNGNALPSACEAANNGNLEGQYAGLLMGMSQRGAIRWARGNQCLPALSGNESIPWPVKWDYKEILAHYYSGVDIVNDNTGDKVAPDNRWNLLWHNNFGKPTVPTVSGTLPLLTGGDPNLSIVIRLQNTSKTNWLPGEVRLVYQWTTGGNFGGTAPKPENWKDATIEIPDRATGQETDELTVPIEAPLAGGVNTLHLDLKRNGQLFSAAGWPHAEIEAYVASNLAFVIDDTGSMNNLIAAAKTTVTSKVDAFTQAGIYPSYYLITYKDDVSYQPPYRGRASNADELKGWINDHLIAADGGDCPENMTGALLATAELAPHSEALVMTDASIKQMDENVPLAEQIATTIAKLREKGVTVNIISYGACSPGYSPYTKSSIIGGQEIQTQDNSKDKAEPITVKSALAGDDAIDWNAKIASETGGHYFQMGTYQTDAAIDILMDEIVTNSDISLYTSQVVSISPKTYNIQIDGTTQTANFLLNGLSGNSNLIIHRPDGTQVNPGDPNTTLTSVGNVQYIQIASPVVGLWQAQVTGDGEFTLSTTGNTAINFDYLTDNSLRKDEQTNLQVSFTGPVDSATFTLTYLDGTSPEEISLFDDGLHADGLSGDGIYGGAWTPTRVGNFYLHVQGFTETGESFQRVAPQAIRVYVPPTVLSSARTTANPTSYYNPKFTVTFSEPVVGVDINDFNLTTEGVSGAAIVDVSGAGSVYTVTVKTGSGIGTIRLDVTDDDTITNEDNIPLGDFGHGNGSFASGESYEKITGTTVTTLGDTDDGLCDVDCSLREAIASAAPDDAITFASGLSGGTIRPASTLFISGNVTLDGSALANPITVSGDTDNNGTGDMQVFQVNSANVAFDSLTITKSKPGIYNSRGNLTIKNSTLAGNGDSNSYYGGIYNFAGILNISNSTFFGNYAAEYGGGVYNYGTLNITNSTFFDNHARYGGGVYNDGGTMNILNSTFSGNSATSYGGAIANDYGVLNYANTILSNSTSGNDCYSFGGSIGTNTHNLVEDGSCSPSLNGDPSLGPLAANGGPTKTMALLVGSQAIDAGDNAICAANPVNNLDQRGITRPQDGDSNGVATCDIGAYEYVDITAPLVVSSMRANPDPTNTASVDFTITFSEPVTGVGAGDFALNKTGTLSNASVTNVSGGPAIYTVSVSTGSGDGTLRLDVQDSAIITDLAGNPLAGLPYTSGDSYTVDKTAPTINTFTVPTLTNSLNIPITAFTASDAGGVASYLITTTPTIPNTSSGAWWSGTAPTTYTVTGWGTYTLYPWAKDAAGNVSAVFATPQTVVVDNLPPDVTSFTAPPTFAYSLTIPIMFSATDTPFTTGLTGYLITTSATPPTLGAAGWSGVTPINYTVGSEGTYTLYPWARDAAGNVSVVYATPPTVVVDTHAPTVNTFTTATLTNSLTIPITAFTALDTLGVTGYLITTSYNPPTYGNAGWSATAPTTYTVYSGGTYALYPWAKDAAGNVSAVFATPPTVVVDTNAPTVNNFTATTPTNSLNIPITDFTALDTIGVAGYLITTSAIPPTAGAAGWSAMAPTSYTVGSSGTYTLYPWAKDGAGNVSAVFLYGPRTVVVDTTAPTVNTFTVPTPTNSLNIPITAFTASDSVGVTGYLITTSATPPTSGAAGWAGTAPTIYMVGSTGTYTLYPWAKDGAGNVSSLFGTPRSVVVMANIQVSIGAANMGNYDLLKGGSTSQSYPGVNDGPVQMTSTGGAPILTSQRILYYGTGTQPTSFVEMMGLPAGQLDTIYWFPWYKNIGDGIDTQLRIDNVSGSTATVHIYIAGTEVTGSPFTLTASGAGQSQRLSFAVNDGPVKIVSNVNIVASERLLYYDNGIPTSFSEMLGVPNSQLSTTYWFPWYKNIGDGIDTQLRIGNVSGSTATVHIYIAGVEVTGSPFTLTTSGAGQSQRLSFALNDGPVKIVSNQNIVASQRLLYYANGTPTSFVEMLGLPNSQLSTTWWFPWYKNDGIVDTNLNLGNASGSTATVHISIAGVEVTGSPFTLTATGAGQSQRLSFAGANNGPVQVISNGNLVVSERILYSVNGTPTSFSEMLGVPSNLLNTTWWLPWYKNTPNDIDTLLRFAVP